MSAPKAPHKAATPPQAINVAVVGHTNVGKTSLMRTLTRQRGFGAVSIRPATTRHVEMAELSVPGSLPVRLYDTPGLEDSSGLLAYLDDLRTRTGFDWIDAIDRFVAEATDDHHPFAQEAKSLAQVRRSDAALYVVDVRDPVRARHRDELEILGRCAVPVLPVLNFIADPDAQIDHWREQLARVNMHALVAFDTVVYDAAGEAALYDKIAALADRFAAPLARLRDDLAARRAQVRRASAVEVAEMLVDAAGAQAGYALDQRQAQSDAEADLKARVRQREAQCVERLLDLHGFGADDVRLSDFAISHGRWDQDIFDPQTLAQYGVSASKAAATGAGVGVAIDVLAGGMTLGGAAATGAALGFLYDTARTYGGRLQARLRREVRLRVDDATLQGLAARQMQLLAALLKRGHGAIAPAATETLAPGEATVRQLGRQARRARSTPDWSALNRPGGATSGRRRSELVAALADTVEAGLDAAGA
ncbi:50S ribosome-binding GTPase [Rhodothalassium salexigens DSM 2132]|uniref:50S ribosome-binding GTPase n=2 Tax=Rhodothalassium salexigens TaxID=1086 RepID=A0A4R2P902_RHOSA|nr:GTPase/DUF3482 domain-containing protein [Rhodothalassium salexigens]MBB4212458.1 hypothetical protein [Rhodothalassium salexigens DSM 2132]TCP31500.1 50S ribosome-binding GTPase [Rhodothalassium salexigens DSM 2132]